MFTRFFLVPWMKMSSNNFLKARHEALKVELIGPKTDRHKRKRQSYLKSEIRTSGILKSRAVIREATKLMAQEMFSFL